MSPASPTYTPEKIQNDLRVLELLSNNFPNVSAASTEIINLEAILNLPKGTEHFIADIHGEHEAFRHILKNASGNIKRKVKGNIRHRHERRCHTKPLYAHILS